jgi:hypothetical protein
MSFNLRSQVRTVSPGRAILLSGFVGALFMACAEGSVLPPPDPGNGGSAGSGGSEGIPPGQIGGTCVNDDSCVEGASCVKVGAESYCTVACPPACPKGTYCAIINGDPMCVPDLDSQCRPCTTVLQCLNPSDACLAAPGGDKFCARDCTTTGECPNGFTCVEGAKYPPKEAPDPPPMPDGGVDGGSDGGGQMPPPAGQAYKFCAPNLPFSCPCTPKRDGVEKSCSIVNQYGECNGVEVCSGDANKFEGCTAQTPAPETCNAKDDNCDGSTDEGEPNELCSSQGPVPPHASYGCSATGMCELGACEPGWAAFPPGPVKDGCPCATEAGEPNDVCANATSAGSVTDAPGSSITLAGTLSAQNDVDVWTFDTVDIPEINTNSYHLKIDLTAPMPNDEFIIDVIHGDACTDTPSGKSTGITNYSWCVNGRGPDGLSGEIPCANDGSQPVHCNDNSSKYFVFVRRKLGATGTCTQYNVVVTATSADPCDFTQKCE